MALIKEKTVSLMGRSVINNVEIARFNANVATNDGYVRIIGVNSK